MLEEDGLVLVQGKTIEVTTKGNAFIRNIIACIDSYLLKQGNYANTFSKAI
jgi:hypothetical protein